MKRKRERRRCQLRDGHPVPHIPKPASCRFRGNASRVVVGLCSLFYGARAADTGGVSGRGWGWRDEAQRESGSGGDVSLVPVTRRLQARRLSLQGQREQGLWSGCVARFMALGRWTPEE